MGQSPRDVLQYFYLCIYAVDQLEWVLLGDVLHTLGDEFGL